MGTTTTPLIDSARKHAVISQQNRRKLLLLSVMASVVGASQSLIRPKPVPKHTSILTGQGWLNELLTGHPLRFKEQLGMEKSIFRALLHYLRSRAHLLDSKHITAAEQLAIFCFMAVHGATNRALQERFQRSGDTISRYFYRVLHRLVSQPFYTDYVQLPAHETPPYIQDDPRFYPFFRNCLGAVDGTHIPAHVPELDADRYRNRKGFLSQNVWASCSFDEKFLGILSGWEGSAADSQVFSDVRSKLLHIPDGFYYLGDAGFPICDALLVPYRGKRYHLKEWGATNDLPQDHEELFNLRHAQLRNVIERIFGFFKRRFRIVTSTPEYAIETQAKLIPALAALHNFIRVHNPDDVAAYLENNDGQDGIGQQVQNIIQNPLAVSEVETVTGVITAVERRRAVRKRDEIAKELWSDFQRQRGENN